MVSGIFTAEIIELSTAGGSSHKRAFEIMFLMSG